MLVVWDVTWPSFASRMRKSHMRVYASALHAAAHWYTMVLGRLLHKYMHEFHADRVHAMCNIQNHTIPVVQLMEFRKLPIKNV
jgi:hypothetical protein